MRKEKSLCQSYSLFSEKNDNVGAKLVFKDDTNATSLSSWFIHTKKKNIGKSNRKKEDDVVNDVKENPKKGQRHLKHPSKRTKHYPKD